MIGIFDSGLGGLTVLAELCKRFANTSFIYLGDHARAPYGVRNTRQIYEFTRDGVEELFSLGCSLVILACNTASTVALRKLQEEWLPLYSDEKRILGIVVPTIEAIVGQSWNSTSARQNPVSASNGRTVGMFATPATVVSQYFVTELSKRDPSIRLIQQACPRLAGLIENGARLSSLKSEVRICVESMIGTLHEDVPEEIILGCTHYALVEDLFAHALPSGCKILSQAAIASLALQRYLDRHSQFLSQSISVPQITFLTTSDPIRVSELANRFLGRSVDFYRIHQSMVMGNH